ncbi:hypothetical protein N657DRAFT_625561 [Parathielavia appendiculata]|uniref:Fucose-specific lectin n=1 Tax=Parathielavia appendiculata TaxID=2587402 RepID=A0AAN6YZW4_9PEZI|nr:hypothetical protein N657DRAFT_625561 [Parathielavia appendiculata]
MEPRGDAHNGGEQPGLEVASHGGLEVAAQERCGYGQSLPEVRPGEYLEAGKEVTTPYSDYPEHSPFSGPPPYPPHGPPAEPAGAQATRKKRLWLVIGGVIAVVVVLAAVLGGVLGSRAANSSAASQTGADSGDSAQNPSTAGNTTDRTSGSNSTGTQLIRQGSGLSVTGWRKPDGGVETYLFYQDSANGLRYSRCDTSRRSTGNESACWEPPISFNSVAQMGTRLAASTIIWGDKYRPQTQLFYTDFHTRLLGININAQLQPNVSDDSVNKVDVSTGPNSSLAAYWPWTIYQDPTGELYHVRNLLGGNYEPSVFFWDNNETNTTTALNASRLAVVPTSTNFSLIAVKAGYAVFYQDAASNKLAVAITDLASPEVPEGFAQPWPVALPDIVIPARSPIAAFSVARPGDRLQRVDTYVLYLDANGDIAVLYTAPSSSSSSEMAAWMTAQPAALKGADRDTDIACLNMPTSFWDAAGADVLLEEASAETARCFFQRGGKVVEVRLDSRETGEWVVVGEVPMS